MNPNKWLNRRFGKLVVIEYAGEPVKYKHKWKCKCDCGNIIVVSANCLLGKSTKSCGCLKKVYGSNHKDWKGFGDISGSYWDSIKNKHRVEGREFNITIQYIWELFLKQDKKCVLSKLPICINFDCKKHKNVPQSEHTASLDRIDSSKGYVEGNVQWVHKDINRCKSDFNQKYFIEICKLISKNH